MARTNTSTGGGGGGVESLNALTGAVTLSAGQNMIVTETGNDILFSANFTQQGKYMISGGAIWSGTGLVYDVSALEYFFNGNKTASQTSVTLDPSDPADNRLDAIVVDEAGTVTVITGDPSASPITPPIPDDQLAVQYILVEAGSTTPTVATESIYLDDPTSNWTFSTYNTASPATGTINFAGTNSPKQGVNDIEASTDLRLGARFVRSTSFDAYQYTMFSVWVRFTGTAVAANKALNVRFENSAGTLVGNTVNLFSYGLSRSLLTTWQLVVIPITAFGALPATVKGLKVIMAGGTVGVARQWDIDYMILTNGSVPQANVPTIVFAKDGTNIASQSGINLIEGTGVTISGVNNPTNNRVDYTINASGGGTPAGSDNQIQINQSGSFFADSSFQKSDTGFNVGLDHTAQSPITFTGSGLDDLTLLGKFSGTVPTTYTVTIDGVNQDFLAIKSSTITGGTFNVGDTITSSSGGSATVLSISNIVYPSFGIDVIYLRVTVTSPFTNNESVDNGLGVSGTLSGNVVTADTVEWTDGVITETNYPISVPFLFLNNGIIAQMSDTGHTLSDEWTWTYSYVNQNVLDFSNNDYKFQSTFGTDTFVYQISDNLLWFGLRGSGSTYTNVAGDFVFSGILNTGELVIGNTIQLATGEMADYSLKATGYDLSIRDALGIETLLNLTSNQFSIINDNSTNRNGIEFNTIGTGLLRLGNLSGGNGTKITIDDVNEHITIGNLPAYDDDAAAGTGGLTAGMLYMTTGSGSAPLNAAGILMIKQ